MASQPGDAEVLDAEWLFRHYREQERLFTSCLPLGDVTVERRNVVVDWIVYVGAKTRQFPQVLVSTVQIADRVFAKHDVPVRDIQLVIMSSYYLAAQFHDADNRITLHDLSKYSQSTYSVERLRYVTKTILETLDYKLRLPSPMVFLDILSEVTKCPKEVTCLAANILVRLLHTNASLDSPSKQAAAAFVVARFTLSEEPWPSACRTLTGFSYADLLQTTSIKELRKKEPLWTVGYARFEKLMMKDFYKTDVVVKEIRVPCNKGICLS